MIRAKEYCLNGHQCKKYQWEILHSFFIFSKNLKKLFIYLFIFGCAGSLAACGLSLVTVHGLLIAVASLVAEHRL